MAAASRPGVRPSLVSLSLSPSPPLGRLAGGVQSSDPDTKNNEVFTAG